MLLKFLFGFIHYGLVYRRTYAFSFWLQGYLVASSINCIFYFNFRLQRDLGQWLIDFSATRCERQQRSIVDSGLKYVEIRATYEFSNRKKINKTWIRTCDITLVHFPCRLQKCWNLCLTHLQFPFWWTRIQGMATSTMPED